MSCRTAFRGRQRPGLSLIPGLRSTGLGWIASWVVGCVLLGGCACWPTQPLGCFPPSCPPKNVFLYSPGLPPDIKRVAVLPLTCEAQRADLQDACETLTPILQAELAKTHKFEVVCISPTTLRACTGRSAWKEADALPAGILDAVRNVDGCDAVLFAQLTAFRAYEPLAVGWRLRLVNARTGQTLWAVDELLDAGQPAVQRDAGRYQSEELRTSFADCGDWVMKHSPRLFAHYATAQVVATLPHR
jgi:hypothetical protein